MQSKTLIQTLRMILCINISIIHLTIQWKNKIHLNNIAKIGVYAIYIDNMIWLFPYHTPYQHEGRRPEGRHWPRLIRYMIWIKSYCIPCVKYFYIINNTKELYVYFLINKCMMHVYSWHLVISSICADLYGFQTSFSFMFMNSLPIYRTWPLRIKSKKSLIGIRSKRSPSKLLKDMF